MTWEVVLIGLLIFLARIGDVSLGTVRTIMIVQGRSKIAFFLGFIEVIIWITVISAIVSKMKDYPWLILFYAGGFATGNIVGIWIERKLAFGYLILRVISRTAGKSMAERLRDKGQSVTIFTGEGRSGQVLELYIVCRRRDLKWMLPLIKEEDPAAFYVTEAARDVSGIMRPISQPATGWRAIIKKK